MSMIFEIRTHIITFSMLYRLEAVLPLRVAVEEKLVASKPMAH